MDRKNLAVDVLALVAYAAAANPALTGIGLHEWIGLGALAVFFAHCALHAAWVSDTLSAAHRRIASARTANLTLDVLTLVALMTVIVSGLMVSGSVLLFFGLYADGYYFWDPLHAMSAKVLLALLIVHVVAHGGWLRRLFRKGRAGGGSERRRKGDAHGER